MNMEVHVRFRVSGFRDQESGFRVESKKLKRVETNWKLELNDIEVHKGCGARAFTRHHLL